MTITVKMWSKKSLYSPLWFRGLINKRFSDMLIAIKFLAWNLISYIYHFIFPYSLLSVKTENKYGYWNLITKTWQRGLTGTQWITHDWIFLVIQLKKAKQHYFWFYIFINFKINSILLCLPRHRFHRNPSYSIHFFDSSCPERYTGL